MMRKRNQVCELNQGVERLYLGGYEVARIENQGAGYSGEQLKIVLQSWIAGLFDDYDYCLGRLFDGYRI